MRRAVAFTLLVSFALVFLTPVPAVRAQVSAGRPWVEPVVGTVIDGFRPPTHVGAPGNRGWEYATLPGTTVVAAGGGVVAFAGWVGGAQYISIDHPGGLRTTYSHVRAVAVARGDRVSVGQVIATTGSRFHFGVRLGRTYLDPARLFVVDAPEPPPRPRLVPVTLR